ncbi:hypothetical protein [Methanoregula sp.]|jgi:hypothetical protein|uniref:hypothetical protein n=1 Tax=Methanoregula sp. TaxID=2052170 RepID=UPI0025FAD6B8|nr:hypothetical protein [Methanoregula sp.]
MGAKKQAVKSKKVWIKALAIVAGVFFVIVMIVSSMGSSWISSLAVVKPGDVAVVDYTIRDSQGQPLLTSNQQLYTQLTSGGSSVMYSKQLTITANQSLTKSVFPVQFYTANTGWASTNQFALFASEYDAISTGIVGLNTNGKKTISLASKQPMTQFWSADQLASNNMSLSSMQVGQLLALGVSDNPEAASDNSTAQYYVRLGEITNKTSDGITLNFAYPSVDVTVVSINKAT